MQVGEGSGAAWYEVGMVGGDPLPVRWQVAGQVPVPFDRQLEEAIPWPSGDPRLPPKKWNRNFLCLPVVVRDLERDLWPSRLYERVWRPARLRDQLRMVVYHRGEHVAWIGAFRTAEEPPFGNADRRRLAPIAAALADALITARGVERCGTAEEGCDLLLSNAGEVLFASEAGRRWLTQYPKSSAELCVWAGHVAKGEPAPEHLSGWRARWTRVSGQAGSRILVHLEPPRPVLVHPSFVLSRTQRELAELAALGASSSEIAAMRGLAPSTVKSHLKQVYELLEIASRSELTRLFADLPSECRR